MKKGFMWMNTMAIMLVLALLASAVPVGADDGLRSGFSKVRDWDKVQTPEAFSFAHAIADSSLYGGVTTSGGDFFMAPRGIHVFDSPGIIDMGMIYIDAIGEAPASGYVEMATPIDGHSYVVRSNGKYGKFYLEETYDWLDPVEYGISWVYQTNGTRTFEGTATPSEPATPVPTGTGGEYGCTYEQYIAAYNKLTSLMSQGKGDTPEAQEAYEQYANMKACYESTLSGTGSPSTSGQTGTGAAYDCPQDLKEAYQQYIAAYNKLTYLMADHQGDTPQAQAAYEDYAVKKACWEARDAGTEPPTTTTTTTTPTPTPTPQQTGSTRHRIPSAGQWTSSWFDTGISVTPGQTISITASGTVKPSTGSDLLCGPDGTFEVDYWLTDYSFLSDCGHAALLAKIGATGAPICVGTGTTFSTTTGGKLWLGVNDTDPGNDSGEFVVDVSLGQASTSTPTPTPTPIPTTTTLIAESRTVAPGGTIQVPIMLHNAQNMGSLGFTLTYDTGVAQVVKVTKGPVLATATFISNTQQAGRIIFGFAAAGGIGGDGSAAVVEFRAVGAQGSSSALTLSQIEATDTSGASVSMDKFDGRVTIGQLSQGDINGDNKVSVLDALRALRMYVQLEAENLILDMNQDGRVNPEDARLIMELAKPK